jgi:hypothetical protein
MSLSDLACAGARTQFIPDGMNWRGVWGIPGIYFRNDVVLGSNDESYICIDIDGSVGQDPTTTPASWALLSSGNATGVSLSAANGSGITVGEPTPNNFTVATNLVAGNGISLSPSGVNTSLTLAANAFTEVYSLVTDMASALLTATFTLPASGLYMSYFYIDLTTATLAANSPNAYWETALVYGDPAHAALQVPGSVNQIASYSMAKDAGTSAGYVSSSIILPLSNSTYEANQRYKFAKTSSGGYSGGNVTIKVYQLA